MNVIIVDCRTLRSLLNNFFIPVSETCWYRKYVMQKVERIKKGKMAAPLASGSRTEAWKENKDSSKDSELMTPDNCYFSLIPNELLLYIFSFLNVYEICRYVSPVCVRWWKSSKDPSLWKHLKFSFEHKVEGEKIKQILELSPQLVSLELESREDGGDLVNHVAACCHRLEKLTAKFCDGLTENTFRSLVENCPDLYYLNVEGSRVCSSECYHLMANFSVLRHLNLSHCHFLDNVGLVKIAKQCKHLEYIDIDGITGIHDNAVVCLTREVGDSLTHLFLDGEYLTDIAYKSLSSCTQLKMLGISFCEQMTDVGLSGIYGLKQLTFLKLRKGVQLTPDGLEKLFENGPLPQLTHINLGECSLLSDKVLIAMANSCSQLTNLVLHWCWEVTDVGISAIVNSCSHIRVLDLVGVLQLTGESFMDINTKLPNLVILDLEQCKNVIDSILQKIVTDAKNPLLRVFDYWGDLVLPVEELHEKRDICSSSV